MLEKVDFIVRQNMDMNSMEYIIRIPLKDIEKLELSVKERDFLKRASETTSFKDLLASLQLIIKKIEDRKGYENG